MKIQFTSGVRNGERMELADGEFRIGREIDNDIVLETEGVSRYHAKLCKQSEGEWFLQDLGSTNGCKVNSEKITADQVLKAGDKVLIGDQGFTVVKLDSPKDSEKAATKTKPGNPEEKTAKNIPESKPINEAGTVKKIVFQPLPKTTDSAKVSADTEKKFEPPIKTVKEKPEEKKSPLLTAKELSESADDIFSSSEKKNNAAVVKPPMIKKHLVNIIFYLSLLVVVVVFVAWFLSYNPEPRKHVVTQAKVNEDHSLLLYYIKTKVSQDNVFRFSLLIENNNANFTIDDLKSGRHHNETIKDIKPEFMSMLVTEIKGTGFMDLQPVSRGTAVNNLDETRELTIALDNKYNSITVQNNSAPMSFEDIESAIEEFADGYDLITYAIPPQELLKRAQESFKKAEEYYANRNANSANLLAAERRYKITVDYLNQFTPKPEIWDIARKRYAEVNTMRKKRWKELTYEVERLERLDKIQDALEVLNEMKSLAPAGSKPEKWARIRITRLSERLNERNK